MSPTHNYASVSKRCRLVWQSYNVSVFVEVHISFQCNDGNVVFVEFSRLIEVILMNSNVNDVDVLSITSAIIYSCCVGWISYGYFDTTNMLILTTARVKQSVFVKAFGFVEKAMGSSEDLVRTKQSSGAK